MANGSGAKIVICFISISILLSFEFVHFLCFLQLMTTQKEMQKQISSVVNLPVAKEGRRLEAALGRSIEKAVKANADALWARFQEENGKNEKLLRDRTQQITNLISNFMNKDLTPMFEKAVKKEFTAIGPAILRTITPAIEKTVSSAVAESFQVRIGRRPFV